MAAEHRTGSIEINLTGKSSRETPRQRHNTFGNP